MTTLPTVPLPSDTVDLPGGVVSIHSLSRTEVIHLTTLSDDQPEAEVFIVSKGTGNTEDEAREWLGSVTAKTAETLINAIAVLSGIRAAGRGPKGN